MIHFVWAKWRILYNDHYRIIIYAVKCVDSVNVFHLCYVMCVQWSNEDTIWLIIYMIFFYIAEVKRGNLLNSTFDILTLSRSSDWIYLFSLSVILDNNDIQVLHTTYAIEFKLKEENSPSFLIYFKLFQHFFVNNED